MILLLKKIVWLPTYKWTSLDMSALYSNIRHNLGIKAVDTFLSKDESVPFAQQDFIKKGIEYILNHNFFSFNGKLYLQTRDTAMGTRFSPSYANLFMGEYESHYILKLNPWTEKIKMYKRYIDDLVFIWNGSESEFEQFTAYLNQNEYGIMLTGKVSSKSIDYLDITLTTQDRNII